MQKIILLRHGEVNIKKYNSISANQFKEWIIDYNNSNIKSEFSRKNEIRNLMNKTDILICSALKRSIQSVELFDKVPFKTNNFFNEADLPSTNWNLLKLNPNIWLIFFRLFWLLGYSKDCESFKDTKQRAKKATKILIELSKQNRTVLLVGHGIMNKLIHKELILQKWNNTKKAKSNNWSYEIFEF